MKREFKLGSKDENARQINVNLDIKKTIMLLLVIGFLLFALLSFLKDDINDLARDLNIGCIDGTKEKVEFGKEYYCGDHYTILEGTISFETYNKMENIIKYGQ